MACESLGSLVWVRSSSFGVCVCDGLLRYVFDLLTTIDELPSKELYIYTL